QGIHRSDPLEHVNKPMAGAIHATKLRAVRHVRSGTITFADHDHRLPNTPLLAKVDASALELERRLERFAYSPDAFRFGVTGPQDTPCADDRGRARTAPDEAQRIAEQAAHAALARSKRFEFETNAVDVTAGLLLKIQRHPLAEREGDLLVTRVVVTG